MELTVRLGEESARLFQELQKTLRQKSLSEKKLLYLPI